MKHISFVWMSLLVCASTWGSLDQGLIAHYPFNGNANDASGNGWDGIVYGATLTTNRFGDADTAYAFDGVNDYINIGNCLGTEKTPFTVSIWVNSTAGADVKSNIYIAKKDSGAWEPGQWGISSSAGEIVAFTFNDIYGNNIPARAIRIDKDIRDGVWHHLCAVMSPEGSEFYIDGELAGTNNVPQLVAQHNSNILIGRRSDSFQPYHTDGILDDVRIYKRALSKSEVMQLFNPIIPFAGFYPSTTHVHFGGQDESDHVFFAGSFVLDARGDGIDPVAEDVMLEAGPLTMEIPAGSFNKRGKYCTWAGNIDGAQVRAIIRQCGEDYYSFLILAHGVDLAGWSNPTVWRLEIGNDVGETSKWLKGHLYSAD